MRWLAHGNVTPAAIEALRRHEHHVQTTKEAGIEAVDASELLKQAHARQLDVITDDSALVNAALSAAMSFGRSIVFLQLAGGEVEQDDAIDRLFERYKRLSPGRMYTVTETRVKVRQLPSVGAPSPRPSPGGRGGKA
jgi:hypothetical protein